MLLFRLTLLRKSGCGGIQEIEWLGFLVGLTGEDKMEKQKPEITMQSVKSSNIASCGHCAKTNTMAVKFKSGGTYHYPDVDREVFDNLMVAESVGKHYHAKIRGNYVGEKV